MFFFSSLNQRNDIIIYVFLFQLFSQVSYVAHGPLVLPVMAVILIQCFPTFCSHISYMAEILQIHRMTQY